MDGGDELRNKLLIAIGLLLVVYVIGIFFYHNFEGWGYLDSAYFITVTITTIGYGDLTPKTDLGKIFTMGLAFTGISIAFYLITQLGTFRERTLDRHVAGRLSILRDMASLKRGDKPSDDVKAKLKKAQREF
ncbi:MAG: potassium channel family protein [Candidatus Micrarchaeota archaeon]